MRVYPAMLCIAIALPAFAAAPPNDKNDWSRIARLGDRIVKVSLRDGRSLKGSVLEFRSDGLTFIEERRLKKIGLGTIVRTSVSEAGRVREIEGRPYLKPGQNVELRLRDGRTITAVVRNVDERGEQLQVAETSAAERIARADVMRVTRNARWKSALLGGVAGAVLLGAISASGKSDMGRAAEFAMGGVVGGGLGLGIGAGIGMPTLVYEAPPD